MIEKELPNALETPKEVTMKLKENNCPYTLTFTAESSSLVINISETDSVPSINYSTRLSLTDLGKESRYFRLFESLEELMPELNNLCNEKKIRLKKGRSSINLIFSLPLKVVQEVELTIPQAKVDTEKVIADLCSTVNELKREIKSLNVGEIPEEQLNENLKSKDILLNEEEKKMVCDWILKAMKSEGKQVNMTLLYRATTNGDSASYFHQYCNGQGYTLTLVRNTKGYRCGGFTSKSWGSSNGSYINDPNAFLFSLEYKEQYFTYDGTNAIYDYSSYGPYFGNNGDLCISDSCRQNTSSFCNFPSSYKGNKSRCLTGGWGYFKVDELEVYKIEFV